MKVRPMKEWIFYAFILVGIICAILLPMTALTYIEYAESGYGIDVEISEAKVAPDNELDVMMSISNPGKLELEITRIEFVFEDGTEFKKTMGVEIDRKGTEEIGFGIPMTADNLAQTSQGELPYSMIVEVYIPHRDAYSYLNVDGTMEVLP